MGEIDIIVGIPTLNEAGTIRNVTQTVDKGLSIHFSDYNCLIVNIDNDSEDGTPQLFSDTETLTQKIALSSGGKGKGRNIFKLFEYGIKKKAKYFCTVDADLISITADWMQKLISPLMEGNIDYTVPVYKRNKYEGNTTNHFCYPILAAYFRTPIRQPIAGDFGLSRRFVKYILEQPRTSGAYHYGIDIFLSMHAVGGGFPTKEVFLGEKVHNPSFGKMVPMFEQVAETTLHVLSQYLDGHIKNKGRFIQETKAHRFGFSKFTNKPTEKSIRKREELALGLLKTCSDRSSPLQKLLSRVLNTYRQDKKLADIDWCYALNEIITESSSRCKNEKCFNRYAQMLAPIYLLRVLSYFKELEVPPVKNAADIIEKQTRLLSKMCLSTGADL